MMKDRCVIMIGGGIQEVEAVRIAKDAGYRVVVTDRNPAAPCFPNADHTAVIDGTNIEELISYALILREKMDIVAVFTLTELVTSVSAVAGVLGLPGATLASAVACQNKWISKKIWKQENIPTPEGSLISSLEVGMKCFERLSENVFIKPVTGFGGQRAGKVESWEELEDYFGKSAPVNKALIMEEFLEGTMHDVNAVFDSEGIFHPLGAFDRFFLEHKPVEIGACYPSQLDEHLTKELFRVTEMAARALGIVTGPVKADLILTSDGVKILEMAPRLHGPKGTLFLTSFAGGKNHLVSALEVMVGKKIRTEHSKPEGVALYQALLPEPGFFQSITGIEETMETGGVRKLLLLRKPGSVIPEYNDSTAVPGYLFASGMNVREAELSLARGKELVRFHISGKKT